MGVATAESRQLRRRLRAASIHGSPDRAGAVCDTLELIQLVTVDTLEPEPTLTVDGIWWHPVAVTDPAIQVSTNPPPVAAALDTIRDTVAVQDAARKESRRHVFRCA